ncbi:hypothetical protein Droror1_Dr00009910 [Drosera rotundifolia]
MLKLLYKKITIFVLLNCVAGTPLHIAAKERNKEAVKFLLENGAFLPPDMNDCRFNPPVHYCAGLEWAYDELKRQCAFLLYILQRDSVVTSRLCACCWKLL